MLQEDLPPPLKKYGKHEPKVVYWINGGPLNPGELKPKAWNLKKAECGYTKWLALMAKDHGAGLILNR